MIYRHILEQHSGNGYKCKGCKQIFSRERPRHQGCQYPDGQNVLLVNILTGEIGEVAELAYQEFKASVDDTIATLLVSNQPRPEKTGTQKRSTSEPRSNRPLKKARTMSVVSLPITSPVARVQPPPPPRFSQAPVRSSFKDDSVAARVIRDSTPWSVTARVTTSDKLSARGKRVECGSKGELKCQTAANVLVAQSSHHSEAEEGEVTDTVDLVSLLVGPTETLEASSMRCHLLVEPHVWLVVDRLCLPPLSLSMTSDGRVCRDPSGLV